MEPEHAPLKEEGNRSRNEITNFFLVQNVHYFRRVFACNSASERDLFGMVSSHDPNSKVNWTFNHWGYLKVM